MLLLLFIILIIITGLLLFLWPSSLIFCYLNMAWLYRVTVFLTVLNLSAEKCTPTETNCWWTRLLSSPFLPRGMCSLLSQKQARLFSWCTPPTPHPPKEGTLYRWEREVLYLQQRWLFCLYNMGFEIFQTFQKQNPELVTYRITYNGTFLILKSN